MKTIHTQQSKPTCEHNVTASTFVPTPDTGEYDIPEQLQIMGHKYTIYKSNTLNVTDNTSAMVNTSLHHIIIDNNFSESCQREALLHEIIEAMNYHMELELEHHKITALSEGLFAVLHNNGLTFCKE